MPHRYSRLCLLLGGLALLVALPVIYMMNPSHAWRLGGGIPVEHVMLLPASADAAGTLQAFRHTALFALVLVTVSILPQRIRTVLICLVVAGAVGVVLMTLQKRMLPGSVYDWTWLFVSRNQFAAFACLTYPLTLACGARSQYRAFLTGRLSSPSGFFYLAAGLLVASVIQTGSRAGILILILQTIGFVAIQWRIRTLYPIVVAPPSVLQRGFIAGALVLGIGLGGVALMRNYSALQHADLDLDFRQQVRVDTVSMWRSRKWWGCGPGSFSSVFPYYQTLPVDEYYFRHAHCEPLQFLAEYGVFGCGLTVLAVGFILGSIGRGTGANHPIPAFQELEGGGLVLAIGGVMLHGLVDFPLRHPLILMLTAAWLAMLARTVGENAENAETLKC